MCRSKPNGFALLGCQRTVRHLRNPAMCHSTIATCTCLAGKASGCRQPIPRNGTGQEKLASAVTWRPQVLVRTGHGARWQPQSVRVERVHLVFKDKRRRIRRYGWCTTHHLHGAQAPACSEWPLAQDVPNQVPKLLTTAIHIPIRPADDLAVGPQGKAAEHNHRRLLHGGLAVWPPRRRSGTLASRSGVRHALAANPNAALRRQAARQPQHLGAVGLHWEICQGPRIGVGADVNAPTEDGCAASRATWHGPPLLGTMPRTLGRFPVQPQQLARHGPHRRPVARLATCRPCRTARPAHRP